MKRRVLDNPDVSTEADILFVGRHEGEMKAGVPVDLDGVDDIEMIEGDGCVADGRGEGKAEETDMIVVEVYIGEGILQHDVEHISCLP